MVRRRLSCGRGDEGKDRRRIAQGRRIARSRHDKELAEKALRRKIKVKLTQSHSLSKVNPGFVQYQTPSGKTVQLRTMKVHGHMMILVPMYMSCDVFHVYC
jgi:hypothetical protein